MLRTKRQKIVDALVTIFKEIDGTPNVWNTNLYGNVYPKMIFWDEINDYPTVSVVSGAETRQYLPGDFKWGFLSINIRIYVNAEDTKTVLEGVFSDIEKALDANNTLTLNNEHHCTDIRILSISDDEGLLAPVGVGEMTLQVQYAV